MATAGSVQEKPVEHAERLKTFLTAAMEAVLPALLQLEARLVEKR